MKKIKKILLAFAPLAAITIATPIVLTACSDTSNVTPPSGDTTIKPSFERDSTNSNSFTLATGSEAQKILDKYKAAKGEAAAQKVLADELANFPKKDSGTLARDVLNMWSNNNWFTITKTAKDEKVKETFISNLNINKAEVDSTSGKATFDVEYKSAFTDKEGKTYESTQLLQANDLTVDTSTKIEIQKTVPNNSYKIDGKDQLLTGTTLLETVNDPKTNLENVLKQTKLSLDAKEVFTSFIKNHSIEFTPEDVAPPVTNLNAPVWNTSVVNTYKTYLSIDSTDNKLLIFDISKASGGNIFNNIKTTEGYDKVQEALKAKATVIANLITVNDYKKPDVSKMALGAEQKDGNIAYADVTISFDKVDGKTGTDTKPTLTFRFKAFQAKNSL